MFIGEVSAYKGEGIITIRFYSEEKLDRIYLIVP
jgi:hypothetical protein